MKRRHTFDEIDVKVHGKREFEVTMPPVHTPSGCRFGYTGKVDYETFEAITARREAKLKEERDRELHIRELREKDKLTEDKINKKYRKYYRNHEKELQKKGRIRYKKYYEENREKILTDKKEQDDFYREKRKVLNESEISASERSSKENESSKEKN